MAIRAPQRVNFAVHCLACTAREAGICAPLSNVEMDVVSCFKSGHRRFPAGAQLFEQGETCDELYTILEGWVILHHLLPEGERQILDFAVIGDFLGFQEDLGAPMRNTAECLTDVTACVFPRSNLEKMFRNRPELCTNMARIAARCEARMEDHLINISRRPAKERVAHFLLEMFYRVRTRLPAERGDSIPLPMTQDVMGDALGLTNVHVNRTLRRLREDGIVEVRNHLLTILDPDALAEAAGFEGEVFLAH